MAPKTTRRAPATAAPSASAPDTPTTPTPLTPHADQQLMIGAVVDHAEHHDTGLVVAPTGYGKSLIIGETISRMAARHQARTPKRFGRTAPFRAVITVPNLTLARQVIAMAGQQLGHAPRVTICCGDEDVAEATEGASQDTLVTLDRDAIAARFEKSPHDGRVDLYVGTNQAGVQAIIDGQRGTERRTNRDLPVHLVAVDEAHRTLGDEFGVLWDRSPVRDGTKVLSTERWGYMSKGLSTKRGPSSVSSAAPLSQVRRRQ